MEKKQLKLIIFDMDGLLVDTEKVYYEGWHHAVKEHRLTVPDDMIAGWVGKGMYESMQELNQLTQDPERTRQIRESREQYFYQELEEGRVLTKPYAKEILEQTKEHAIVGLATSTMEEKAGRVLEKLGLLNDIDYPVFGSDIDQLKPAPDVYLEVLKRSKIDAEEAIAIEDSITGAQAAEGAGLSALLIPDSNFYFDQENIPSNVLKVGKDLQIVRDLFQ